MSKPMPVSPQTSTNDSVVPQTAVDGDQSQLQAEIDQLKQSLAQSQEATKRSLADYANLQKRTLMERQQYVAMAGAALLSDILPTLDHLELAIAHGADASIKMIRDEFVRALSQHGLQPMDVVGRPFDAQTMEAVDTAEGEKDKVVAVQQAGYWLGKQVLRHAKVVVGNTKMSKEEV
jgi:molecular chaperone GrpE